MNHANSVTEDNNLIPQGLVVLQQKEESLDFVGVALEEGLLIFLSAPGQFENALEFIGESRPDLETFRIGQITVLNKFPPAAFVQSWSNHIDERLDVFVLSEGSGGEANFNVGHQRIGNEGVSGGRQPLCLVKYYESPGHQFHPFVFDAYFFGLIWI